VGAICGIYYGGGRSVPPETGTALLRGFGMYQADAVQAWEKKQVFLGCLTQYITPESAYETLPWYDEGSGLAITADAIIDNRGELFDRLGIDLSNRDAWPDSRLILQAYRKWGVQCPAYLVGDFAFAIWNEKRRELFCAVDHTGTRSFYYYRSAEVFAFSTLIRPLFVVPGITRKYNEVWIADFLAIPTVMHQLDPELTIYEDIYLLPAGHALTVRPDEAVKRVYWSASTEPAIRLRSDCEYEEAFRDVLGTAVRCRLRSIHQVGVKMSGGLDSTSVACLAAPQLGEGGRRLTAFTAVPMTGFRNWLGRGVLANESAYVEAVREHIGNIDVVYCRSEGKHPLSDNRRLLAVLEQPYKVLENLFWLEGILSAARERDIGVLLDGSAGNRTISFGGVQPYLLYLLRRGHFRRLLSENRSSCIKAGHTQWQSLRHLMVSTLPYGLKEAIYRRTDPGRFEEVQDMVPINPDFARRMGVEERFRRYRFDFLFIEDGDSRSMRRQGLQPDFFSHIGQITTKQNLAYRLVQRDPTMDKRVIEFCLRVPEDQYVRDGSGRLLVRRAMVGLLPDKVRLNTTERGYQSADWAQRLQPLWPELKGEIGEIGGLAAEREYLDVARIRTLLAKNEAIEDHGPINSGLRMLIRSLIFSRFLRQEGMAQ
jgi:asparagine synthase (glutamine-hydrolysing)